MRNGRCYWVVGATADEPAHLCGKRTASKMVRDDDWRLVRKYDTFCAEHKAKAEAQAQEDDE